MTYVQTAENANGGSRGTIHLYELSGLQELSLGGTQTISATGLPEPSAFNPNIGAAVSAIGGNPANALSDVAQVEASPFVDGLLPVSISSSEDEFGAAFMFGTMQSDTPAASDGAATLYAVGDLGSVNHAAALIAKAGPITKLEFSNSFTTNLVSSIAVAFSSASGFKAAWALGANQVIQ